MSKRYQHAGQWVPRAISPFLNFPLVLQVKICKVSAEP
jgi:hypothetical protein